MNKKQSWAVLIVLAMASAPVAAQAPEERGIYIGGSAGKGASKKACDGAMTCDNSEEAFKVFGGYQFNRNVALEIGYADLGDFAADGTETSVRALDAAAQFTAPISQRFALIGRLGAYRSHVEASGVITTATHNTSFTWGLGVLFNVSRSFGLRAEWQNYSDIGGGGTRPDDIDFFSLGLVLRL
jgi:OmpA-OmpF porin, OOP family